MPANTREILSLVEGESELARMSTGYKEQRTEDSDPEEEDESENSSESEDLASPTKPTKAAFNQILEKIEKAEINTENSESVFLEFHKYLEDHVDEKKNILHVLAYYEGPLTKSLKTFITQFTKRHPSLYSSLMVMKDDTGGGKTPLYVAIAKAMKKKKKNAKLVSWMCENKAKSADVKYAIQTALGTSCGKPVENCIHAAIRLKLPPEVTIDLISKATEETLKTRDPTGWTPLHYAVEYQRCTESQLDIVKKLIESGDSALDELGNKPDRFSVYQHHVHSNKSREKSQATRNGEHNAPGDLSAKLGKVPKESIFRAEAQKRPLNNSQMDNFQGVKDDVKMKDGGGLKRRDSGFSPLPGPKEQHLLVPTPQVAVTKPPEAGPTHTSKITSTSNDGVKPKRKRNTEPEATEASAENIRETLQLHYLRTRSPEVAASRLYGKNIEEIQICFDYFGASAKVHADDFKASFKHIVFDKVLQYVAFPNVEVVPPPALLDLQGKSQESKGRTHMIFFFDWLREKGVKRILKVIVDDLEGPAHSDEAIEKVLHGFDVEILDWRKVDLCPELICKASRKMKEVYLRWSGNNAVLRAWSEPDGLKKLEDLTKIHLYIKQDLETRARTVENIDRFCERLGSSPPATKLSRASSMNPEQVEMPHQSPRWIDVTRIEGGRNELLLTTRHSGVPIDDTQESTLHPHRWLECMDHFADMIQNIWSWALKQKLQQHNDLQKPVEVALIDDGVDLYHERLRGKISGGKSFDYGFQSENRIRPYWVSERGHGTVMADMMCRVCPIAKIYVIRLETHDDPNNQKARIVPRSAAKAIDAAVDRKVQIISMSWTTKQPGNNEEKEKFDAAVRRAISSGILLFCSAGDKGAHLDSDYPMASNSNKIFKIGAAKANGNAWDWVGDIHSLDFIIPGHEVQERASGDNLLQNFQAQTGSSVATALGVGLAALIIYCVQLAAMHTQMSQPAEAAVTAVTTTDLADVKKHENMKAAFENIGTSKDSQNKFIEVWKLFEKAAKDIKPLDKEKRLEKVADLARNLVRISI